ncbi:MAG: hypothetical protein MUP98_06265 [Candidatus Aminicenantes bacterium]|nr:hypothetical protein [Candidatus Aminicenantes bacterium]
MGVDKVEFEYNVNGTLQTISLEKKGDIYIVSDGNETQEVDIQVISRNIISIKIGERSVLAYIASDKDQLYVQLEGVQILLSEPSQLGDGFQRGEEQSQEDMLLIKAPMPGKVIKINVSEKDKVRKNQTLAIVEAMKMENEIKSSIDGIVKKIFCKSGDLVETQNPLIELE